MCDFYMFLCILAHNFQQITITNECTASSRTQLTPADVLYVCCELHKSLLCTSIWNREIHLFREYNNTITSPFSFSDSNKSSPYHLYISLQPVHLDSWAPCRLFIYLLYTTVTNLASVSYYNQFIDPMCPTIIRSLSLSVPLQPVQLASPYHNNQHIQSFCPIKTRSFCIFVLLSPIHLMSL